MIKPNQLRINALAWWKEQSTQRRTDLVKKHLPPFASHQFVTGLQIDEMYMSETDFKPHVNLATYDLKTLL
jgi:hypothetical protein